VAFQANTGHLGLTNGTPGSWTDTNLGMAAGTSPVVISTSSIVTDTNPIAFENNLIIFQAEGGHLGFTNGTPGNWTPGSWTDSNLGMMAGTSPSVVGMATGGPRMVFQADTGFLGITHGVPGNWTDTALGMMAGTSPSVNFL
jgi:hypothetical protein